MNGTTRRRSPVDKFIDLIEVAAGFLAVVTLITFVSVILSMIAADGSLGIMIPPSTVLTLHDSTPEQNIGKRFIAGIIPGLIAAGMYIATINFLPPVRLSAQAAAP